MVSVHMLVKAESMPGTSSSKQGFSQGFVRDLFSPMERDGCLVLFSRSLIPPPLDLLKFVFPYLKEGPSSVPQGRCSCSFFLAVYPQSCFVVPPINYVMHQQLSLSILYPPSTAAGQGSVSPVLHLEILREMQILKCFPEHLAISHDELGKESKSYSLL